MSLPRVLIIGQPFNNDTGGGITLTNLFSGWDKNKIAVACSGYLLLNNIDTGICDTYYQLGHKERKWVFPLNYLRRKYYSGLIKFDEKRVQNLSIPKSRIRLKIISNYFYPLLEYFGVFQFISLTQLSDDLCLWLDEFKPDVIYAQASSRENVLFCLMVHSYLNKPLIFHMMDDWPSMISDKGPFKRKLAKKIDREFRELLNRADVLMSISEPMASEYKKRYNKEFITFHNPINIQFWKKYQRTSYELSDSPSILYAGRTGLGIETSLELIAKAIQQVNTELKLSLRFTLQTSESPAWSSKYSCVEYRPFVSYEELPRVFSSADMLILPYDFSKKSLSFIKHSMPTKAPEYMISGTPIIIFAPGETALVKYATEHNWAVVITEDNINALSKAIKNLIENESARKEIAQNAKIIGEKNHNSIKVTNDFKNTVSSLFAGN